MTTLTVKAPKQFKTCRGRKFVPIAITLKDRATRDTLIENFREVAGNLHGDGRIISENDGVEVWELIVEDGTYSTIGDWLVRYEYSDECGIEGVSVWALAEIA